MSEMMSSRCYELDYILCVTQRSLSYLSYQQLYTNMYQSEVTLGNICCTAVQMR